MKRIKTFLTYDDWMAYHVGDSHDLWWRVVSRRSEASDRIAGVIGMSSLMWVSEDVKLMIKGEYDKSHPQDVTGDTEEGWESGYN